MYNNDVFWGVFFPNKLIQNFLTGKSNIRNGIFFIILLNTRKKIVTIENHNKKAKPKKLNIWRV